jgi:hypothetical protein
MAWQPCAGLRWPQACSSSDSKPRCLRPLGQLRQHLGAGVCTWWSCAPLAAGSPCCLRAWNRAQGRDGIGLNTQACWHDDMKPHECISGARRITCIAEESPPATLMKSIMIKVDACASFSKLPAASKRRKYSWTPALHNMEASYSVSDIVAPLCTLRTAAPARKTQGDNKACPKMLACTWHSTPGRFHPNAAGCKQ